MPHKQVLFRSIAREKLLRGATQLADAVTGDAVGDGTSTSVVLAHAIFADGVRNVVAGAIGNDEPFDSGITQDLLGAGHEQPMRD